MSDAEWQQAKRIFDEALHQKPEERASFVSEVCGDDKSLCREVESLLSSFDGAGRFLETPAIAKFADVIQARKAHNVEQAQELLSTNSYDAIFLDHDLHPEHYNSINHDDTRTGFAIASWLASNPELQRAATIMVHTRNADGAMRMVEEMRRAGRSAEYLPFPLLAERIKHYWKR